MASSQGGADALMQPIAWLVAGFAMAAVGPIINGSNQAIWQAKVAPDVQGRVFAVTDMLRTMTSALGQFDPA